MACRLDSTGVSSRASARKTASLARGFAAEARLLQSPVGTRLTRETLSACGVNFKPGEVEFISGLFLAPLSLSRTGFKSWKDFRVHHRGLEQRLIKATGANPFYCIYPMGRAPGQSGGFKLVGLNPDVFEVGEQTPIAGVHYAPVDFLGPEEYKIFSFLLQNNCCPRDVLYDKSGFNPTTVKNSLVNKMPAKCSALGIPPAVCYTGAKNFHAYFVNPDFCRVFGLSPVRWKPSLEAFGVFERQLIEYVATHQNQNREEIARALNWVGNDVRQSMEHAGLCSAALGLPNPFVLTKGGPKTTKRVRLSQTFLRAIGLKLEPRLEHFFTPNQENVIKFVALHPLCRTIEVQRHFGFASYDRFKHFMAVLKRVCKECGFSVPLARVGDERFLVSPDFVKKFGISCTQPDPADLLTGQRRAVYLYLRSNPAATYAEVARALGISEKQVHGAKAAADFRLRKLGFGKEAEPKSHFVSQYASFHSAFGRWPTEKDLKRYRMDTLIFLAEKYGGFATLLEEAKVAGVPNLKMIKAWKHHAMRYGFDKIHSWDYSRFSGDGAKVVELFEKSILCGIGLRDLNSARCQCEDLRRVEIRLSALCIASGVSEERIGLAQAVFSAAFVDSPAPEQLPVREDRSLMLETLPAIRALDYSKFGDDAITVRNAFSSAVVYHLLSLETLSGILERSRSWDSAIRAVNNLILKGKRA